MKVLNTEEFLERLNIGRLNIRDINLSEPRLLSDELVKKYNLVFNAITSRYDCDADIEVEQDLIKDGKLITDFGIVKGRFNCFQLELVSLKGCPVEVGSSFYCSYNNLTSLEGCPTEVGGNFDCSCNNLISLKGCPVKVKNSFWCENQKNAHKFTVNEVKSICRVGHYIYV